MLDFEAVETAARRQVLVVAARLLEQRLNADTSDYSGPTRRCRCGQTARYAGRRAKRFETVLGPIRLERSYYHCGACRKGFCPRDRALGLEGSSLSPALTRMVGLVGALVSFAEGSELLGELAGIGVTAKQVERKAEQLGQEVAEDERQVLEADPPDVVAPTMYLGMDGTGVPMRPEALRGRRGKQPDGSAKTREVKLCTVWSAESRDEDGMPVRDEGSVSYSAAIESAATLDTDREPSAFAQRAVREARRRNFDSAARRVVLGDGAPWIWKLAQEHFPGAIQIVDRYHAKHHLSDVAKAIYGADDHERSTRWAKQRHAELDAGDLNALVRALRRHAGSAEARRCIKYIQHNRARMQYAQFHDDGLCTSTAIVEAACKTVIAARLKRSGMRWTVSGANAIIALRCTKLSGRFEDFWERRAEHCRAA
mgnify:CR=1 FL=1